MRHKTSLSLPSVNSRLAQAYNAGANAAVDRADRSNYNARSITLYLVVLAVVAMPAIAMIIKLNPQTFGSYIAPVTGIAGTEACVSGSFGMRRPGPLPAEGHEVPLPAPLLRLDADRCQPEPKGDPGPARSCHYHRDDGHLGHLFPDAEDLSRGAINAILAVALTKQERNQETW